MQFAFVDAAADPAGSQKCCRNGLRNCHRHSPVSSNSSHCARPPARHSPTRCPPDRCPSAPRPGRPFFSSCAAATRPLTHAPPPSQVGSPLHPPLSLTPVPVRRFSQSAPILAGRAPPCPCPSPSSVHPRDRPPSSGPTIR